MKEREEQQLPQEKDRHLDVPSEANRDKHINFLEAEENASGRSSSDDDAPFFIPNNTPLKGNVNREEKSDSR